MNNLDATYEQACMETSQENLDTSVFKYGLAGRIDKKENYYTELSNTITTFNYKSYTPLSNMNIQETIMKFIM